MLAAPWVVGGGTLVLATVGASWGWTLPDLVWTLAAPQPWATVAWLTVGFALWTAAPDRRDLPTALAAGSVFALAWWGATWPARPDPAPDAGVPMRILSWNLAGLRSPGVDDPAGCTRAALEALRPDVLTLQEAHGAARTFLAEAVDLSCLDVAPPREDAARGGLANVVCVSTGGAWRHRIPDDATARPLPWRSVQAPGAPPVSVHTMHLPSHRLLQDPIGRLPQALRRFGTTLSEQQQDVSAALASRPPGPVVLTGDLNATPDLPPVATLRRTLVDAWQVGGVGLAATVHPLGMPLQADHVFVSQDLAVRHAEVPSVDCSDHRPVLVDLVVPADTP